MVWPSSICEDKTGNIYVGCLKNGLFKYNPQTNGFTHIKCSSHPELPIKTLYNINQDAIIICAYPIGTGMVFTYGHDATGTDCVVGRRFISHILEKHGVKIDLTLLPLRIVIIIIACIYTIVHHLSKFSILNSLFSII
jgi:UPF0288 family protein (methanogenesis marker protein 3)